MNSYSKSSIFLLVSLLISQAGVVAARASSVLQLSNASSDETPAGALDARLEFSLAGSTLLLTVTNQTSIGSDASAGFGFDISDIYFNAPPEVSGIILDGDSTADGWLISTNEQADGFGVFDFALLGELGNDLGEIGPGASRQFELGLSGAGPFAETDFTSHFSTIPPGNRPALAAIKFTNGPGDDSAFGAVIPEPASLLLLLSGVGLIAKRRLLRNV
jgi:hypothetical protein